MTIYNGLVTSLVFNGNDISEDVLTAGITAGGQPIDVSALDLIGFQRILGRVDAVLNLTCRVSSAAAGAHATISPATAAEVAAACVLTTTAGPVATFTGIVGPVTWTIDNSLGFIMSFDISLSSGVALAWS